MMKSKKRLFILSFVVILSICSIFIALAGCGSSNENNNEQPITGIISLDKETLTLEKRERYQLTATLEDIEGDLTWSSSDSSVASVESGVVVALKAGQTRIKASINTVEAICYVTVTDNNQNLVVETNLMDEENLLVADQKDVSVLVKYNNKVLEDAKITYKTLGEEGVISFENGKITALKKGTVQFVINASWQDIEYDKVITISIVPNLMAKLSENNSVSLKTVGEEDEISFELNVIVYEDNKELNDNEYIIEYAKIDEKVIRIEDNKVYAVGKGTETISAVVTSLLTNNSITVELPVSVLLVNQDKTSTIQLKKIAWDDKSSSLALTDVFSDVDEEILSDCTMVSIVDITDVKFNVPYVNGEIDLEFLKENSVLGNRVWRIECEKFSYDVCVFIEKINTTAIILNMAGTYKPVKNDLYTYGGWESVKILENGTINPNYEGEHALIIEPIDENYGIIKDGKNSKLCDGYYVKDGDNYNLFITVFNNGWYNTVHYCKNGVTPISEKDIYEKLAGSYTYEDTTEITLTHIGATGSDSVLIGNAKVCSGKVNGTNIIADVYDIIPTSSNAGIIHFRKNSFIENFYAKYFIEGNNVKISLIHGENTYELTKN